jgi:hypothetical protein
MEAVHTRKGIDRGPRCPRRRSRAIIAACVHGLSLRLEAEAAPTLLVGRDLAARLVNVIAANFMSDDPAPHLAAAEIALGKVLSAAPNYGRALADFGLTLVLTNRAVRPRAHK